MFVCMCVCLFMHMRTSSTKRTEIIFVEHSEPMNRMECRDYFMPSLSAFPMANIVSNRLGSAWLFFCFVSLLLLFFFIDGCMRDMGIDYLFLLGISCFLSFT